MGTAPSTTQAGFKGRGTHLKGVVVYCRLL